MKSLYCTDIPITCSFFFLRFVSVCLCVCVCVCAVLSNTINSQKKKRKTKSVQKKSKKKRKKKRLPGICHWCLSLAVVVGRLFVSLSLPLEFQTLNKYSHIWQSQIEREITQMQVGKNGTNMKWNPHKFTQKGAMSFAHKNTQKKCTKYYTQYLFLETCFFLFFFYFFLF